MPISSSTQSKAKFEKNPSLTPIMLQYQKIKDQYKDYLVFFRLGDFYELFYQDAKIASSALDIVLTARGKQSGQEVPMCGVPAHASEAYIARLIKKGYRVAICEQVESEPAALDETSEEISGQKKGSKKLIDREVVRIITPGTLTEDQLLEAKSPNFLMALFGDQDLIGLSFVDISTGDFFVENQSLATLPHALQRLQPQEILVPECLNVCFSQQTWWPHWEHKVNFLPDCRFDLGEQRLATFFHVQSIKSFGPFSSHEISSAGGLLDYILITQKRHVLLISPPKRLDRRDFLEMDDFTRRNLELVQTLSGEKDRAFLAAIDKTLTSMGGRLLLFRLNHPLRHLATIQQRLDSIEFFLQETETRQNILQSLEHFPDIERAITRLIARRGSPKDLGALRAGLNKVPLILDALRHQNLPPELSALVPSLDQHQELKEKLNQALHATLPPLLRDGNVIAPGYDEQLDALRNIQNHSQGKIQELQKKYQEETGIQNLKIRHNTLMGHYIEVSHAAMAKMPFHFLLRQSLSSGARYTSVELDTLDQKQKHADQHIATLEMQLFDALVQNVQSQTESLKEMIHAIAILDVSCALAELASEQNYCRPLMDHSQECIIQGGRHPVVEKLMDQAFIKNHCILNQTTPIWILTGPNMAGKSTFLRQNALIVLLAHMGSFVPADYALIGLVDRIFTRVGASDDLGRGMSTFMTEMIETATIFNQASSKSFVILDEIGRGTSTQDGLAIALACLEYIAQKIHCRTLFSTHYHELSSLHLPGTECYTLRIQDWKENLVFFHEIQKGAAKKSYGIHVARMAGMPVAIAHRAEQIARQLENSLHASLDTLLEDPKLYPSSFSQEENRG